MFITHRWCWFQVTWASDSDITVRMKKMKASVRDLYIHGQLRVQLKPLIQTLPFVGGLQVCKIKFMGPFCQLYVAQMYFLNNPSIDFAVGGLANVTDLPGINSILRYK